MKRDFGLRAAALALGLAASMAASAAPVQWAGNGHWYDVVLGVPGAAPGFTWDEAFADAPSKSHMGMTGYMATVTSAAENAFLAANFGTAGTAWLGGTDRQTEGTWQWMNGPEAGQAFVYFNWYPGEPNNCCNGEDDLVTNWGPPGNWNDIGLPSSPDYRVGYMIEYSPAQNGVPEPGVMALLGLGLAGLGVFRRGRR
jgi:hypothetical protein